MSQKILNLIILNNDSENEKIISYIKNKDLYSSEFVWPHGETLIHWCAAYNNYKLLDYILSHNLVHVNIMNFRFTSAISYAAQKNNKEAISILIKHNANTSMRSGFSGMLPISQTNDLECKKLISEHESKFLPIQYQDNSSVLNPKNPFKKSNFTHYQCILFRIYMYYNSILTDKLNPYNNNYDAPESATELNDIFKNTGLLGLSKICYKKLKTFVDSLSTIEELCANCHKNIDLKKCSKCKKARFCNVDCQRAVFKFHKFDCKKL